MRRWVILGIVVAGLFGCSDQTSEPDEGTTTSSISSTTPTTTEPTTSTTPDPVQVLVFHKTTGFRHDSIPAGITAITDLGGEHGYTVTATDDATTFTDALLERYDVVVFLNTTGDVLDEFEQQVFERFIQAGNGFVGIHAATDTEYGWPWYEGLVGAYFDSHPSPQSATVEVHEPAHPIMQGVPSSFERFDEWYDFASLPGPDVTILATLEESSYTGGSMGEPHPIVWAQDYDGGRSFYTAFGHTAESFSEPLVVTLIANAIDWAADPN